jgi:ketosteroid isomerase-like protein
VIYWDVRDERIDVFGDVALVRATNKHIVRRNGQDVVGMTVYTDTYLREGGRWLCIQAQLTTVAPENYPGDETIVSRYINGVLQTP